MCICIMLLTLVELPSPPNALSGAVSTNSSESFSLWMGGSTWRWDMSNALLKVEAGGRVARGSLGVGLDGPPAPFCSGLRLLTHIDGASLDVASRG